MKLIEGIKLSSNYVKDFISSLEEEEDKILMGFECEFYHEDNKIIFSDGNNDGTIDLDEYSWDEFFEEYNSVLISNKEPKKDVLDDYIYLVATSSPIPIGGMILIKDMFEMKYTTAHYKRNWVIDFIRIYKKENSDWKEKFKEFCDEDGYDENEHSDESNIEDMLEDFEFNSSYHGSIENMKIKSNPMHYSIWGITDKTLDFWQFVIMEKMWNMVNNDYNLIMNHWFHRYPKDALINTGIEILVNYEFDGNFLIIKGNNIISDIENFIVHKLYGRFEYVPSSLGNTGEINDNDTWYLVHEENNMLEISSSIEDFLTSLDNLEDILNFMNSNKKINTDQLSGVHINLSIPMMMNEKPNWVKIAFLLGEQHVLEIFDRLSNKYTKSQLTEILRIIKEEDIEQIMNNNKINGLIEYLNSSINMGKYFSFNIQHYNNQEGRVEFRMIGNTKYEEKFSIIRKIILQHAIILKASYSNVLFQKEFLKKLASKIIEKYPNYNDKYPFDDNDYNRLYRFVSMNLDSDIVSEFRKLLNLMYKHKKIKYKSDSDIESFDKIEFSYFLRFIRKYINRYFGNSVLNENTSFDKRKIIKIINNVLFKFELSLLPSHIIMTGVDPNIILNSYIPHVTEYLLNFEIPSIMSTDVLIVNLLFGDEVKSEIKKKK